MNSCSFFTWWLRSWLRQAFTRPDAMKEAAFAEESDCARQFQGKLHEVYEAEQWAQDDAIRLRRQLEEVERWREELAED